MLDVCCWCVHNICKRKTWFRHSSVMRVWCWDHLKLQFHSSSERSFAEYQDAQQKSWRGLAGKHFRQLAELKVDELTFSWLFTAGLNRTWALIDSGRSLSLQSTAGKQHALSLWLVLASTVCLLNWTNLSALIFTVNLLLLAVIKCLPEKHYHRWKSMHHMSEELFNQLQWLEQGSADDLWQCI